MKMFTFSQFKSNLDKIFELIKDGEEIVVSESGGQQKLAILSPYTKSRKEKHPNQKRPLGIVKGKASFEIKQGFKLTEQEFLSS